MAPADTERPPTAAGPPQAEHETLMVQKKRSRSTSRDDRQRSTSRELIIENTFFRLVGGEDARSATPPGARRRPRARSLPSPDRKTYNALEAPYLPLEASQIGEDGHRRYRSRPHQDAGEHEGALAVVQEAEEECEVAEVLTTVVIRNMPQAYTRDMFLELLDSEGFQNQYDFIYVPLDFGLHCSFGYAFVNMVSPQAAQKFHEVFAGYSRWAVPWGQEAEVGWATLQGLEKHVEKYRNSPVMHESVGHEARPILMQDGKRVPFPPPTKKIGLVKRLRTRRRSTDADAGDAVAPTPDWDYQDTDEELQPTTSPTRSKDKAHLGGGGRPLNMAQSPLLAGLYAMPAPRHGRPQDHHGARPGHRKPAQKAATEQQGGRSPEKGHDPVRFGPPGRFSRTQTGPLSTSSGYETPSVHSDASSRVSNWRFAGQQGPGSHSDIDNCSDASTRVPTSPHRRGRSDISKQLSSSGGGHSKHAKEYKHSLLADGLVPETQTSRPLPWSPPCSTQPCWASQRGRAPALA